jgi:hypothetical protein
VQQDYRRPVRRTGLCIGDVQQARVDLLQRGEVSAGSDGEGRALRSRTVRRDELRGGDADDRRTEKSPAAPIDAVQLDDLTHR